MSKLNQGEVEIVLGGQTRVLRPTINAVRALSRIYDGLDSCRNKLATQNLEVTTNVIRYGLGLNDAEARNLDAQVYRQGLTADLILPLMRFVAILGNGGKPVEEDPADGGGADGAGEGEAAGNL
ncbi:hypothetical protein STAQ_27630 [Allostella sp. ATCC 35155]|nr:hypothetical protein STAQ_27630 [Stella sp. ATCC 35155]